jgi:hypothetical protein
VGWARVFGHDDHAGIWHGTAASWTDLDPGFGLSRLLGTCGSAQVGWSHDPVHSVSAGIWFGTASSFVSLAPYLPAGYDESFATSVAFGNGLYYVGGYAFNHVTEMPEAFLWVGIPAPGSSALALLAAGLVVARRRR